MIARRWPATFAAAAALTACTGGPFRVDHTSTAIGGLGRSARFYSAFTDCTDFLAYVRQQALARVNAYGLDDGRVVSGEATAGPPTTMASAVVPRASDAAAPAAGASSSSTNTQEAGVDEGDQVETDGRIVYAVTAGSVLRVVDTAAGAQLAQVALGLGNHQLLLDGHRLTVVTSVGPGGYVVPVGPAVDATVGAGMAAAGSAPDNPPVDKPIVSGPIVPPVQDGHSEVRVFDVTNPARPREVGGTELEGDVLAARAADGLVRLVVHTRFAERLPLVHPTSDDPEAAQRALAQNRAVITTADAAAWLPRLIAESPDRGAAHQALACAEVGRPSEFSGLGVTWVATLDPRAPQPVANGSAGVVADGDTVYASPTALFVATVRWPGDEGDVAANHPEPVHTLVHGFSLDGRGSAAYLASGSVPGTLLDQFSLSAEGDFLRVATTAQDAGFGAPSQSSVRVLRRDGDHLVEVGSVEGLGRGEQIYAVRFVGDLAYVVTFHQTDPLHVIDLRDPSAPRLAGELQIPGYSAYLHPLGDGLVLGVGEDAGGIDRGSPGQLSLFDVADPAMPRRLAVLRLGGITSAERDHHAFLWWPATSQVVVPVQRFDAPSAAASVMVAKMSGGHLVAQGTVSQRTNAGAIDRALVVAGRLVTVSDAGLQVNDLTTFATRSWVPFT